MEVGCPVKVTNYNEQIEVPVALQNNTGQHHRLKKIISGCCRDDFPYRTKQLSAVPSTPKNKMSRFKIYLPPCLREHMELKKKNRRGSQTATLKLPAKITRRILSAIHGYAKLKHSSKMTVIRKLGWRFPAIANSRTVSTTVAICRTPSPIMVQIYRETRGRTFPYRHSLSRKNSRTVNYQARPWSHINVSLCHFLLTPVIDKAP